MQRAIRVIREGYEAFNRGDFDAAAKHLHPEVEWGRIAEVETPIEGRDAVRANMDPNVWSEQQVEINRIETVGESLLLDTVFHAKGSSSGIELETASYHLWKIVNGKGRRLQVFLDRDEAAAAADEDERLADG